LKSNRYFIILTYPAIGILFLVRDFVWNPAYSGTSGQSFLFRRVGDPADRSGRQGRLPYV